MGAGAGPEPPTRGAGGGAGGGAAERPGSAGTGRPGSAAGQSTRVRRHSLGARCAALPPPRGEAASPPREAVLGRETFRLGPGPGGAGAEGAPGALPGTQLRGFLGAHRAKRRCAGGPEADPRKRADVPCPPHPP